MGNTIWVDVEGRPENDLPQDNSILLRLAKNLDTISKKLKVACISEFFDYSALAEEFAEFLPVSEAPESQENTRTKGIWFDPAPALAAVRALHRHLEANPADLRFNADKPREHWPKDLMVELKYCEDILEDALSRGKKFRFLLVS